MGVFFGGVVNVTSVSGADGIIFVDAILLRREIHFLREGFAAFCESMQF